MATKDRIVVISSDGEKYEIKKEIAQQSKLLTNMIEDNCINDNGIPLPNIMGQVLARVIEYAEKHVDSTTESEKEEEMKAWDTEFAKSLDLNMLYLMLLASNFLDMQPLLGVLSQCVTDMIKGKKPEEIRKTFGIKNDFTREEEEHNKKENQWAFQD